MQVCENGMLVGNVSIKSFSWRREPKEETTLTIQSDKLQAQPDDPWAGQGSWLPVIHWC